MDIREGLGDGDIFFKPVMSNSVEYNHPVDDPLYAAHKKVTVREGLKNVTRYMADIPMKAVGCVQQVMIVPLEDHFETIITQAIVRDMPRSCRKRRLVHTTAVQTFP
jgi:hypothetical protein